MNKVGPRTNRICWDDHHMLLAMMTSQRSPDPNTQVGAAIVSDNRVIGLGYNGLPKGMCPSSINWARENADPVDTKYPFVEHAEKNAINNTRGKIAGSILYVTLYPCADCAKHIIQSDIKEIIYLENPYIDEWSTRAAAHMFAHVDIIVRQHVWNKPRVDSCLAKLSEKILSDQ